MDQTTSLCDLCRGINVNSIVPFCPPEYDKPDSELESMFQVCYQHHLSFNDLESSAGQCRMCHLMWWALEERNRDQPEMDEEFKSTAQSSIWLISGDNMFFDLTLPKRLSQLRVNVGGHAKMKSVDLALYTDPDDPLGISQDIVGRRPAYHSSCPEVGDIMRKWLSECLAHHPRCRGDQYRSGLDGKKNRPTRLLLLNDDRSAKLIETEDQEYQYAALTYCWGTSQPVVTTRKNYGQLERGFGKTIHDAIQITLDLNLKYLWVDALCIIQDDKNDWQRESSKMGSIYRNAQVTISATAASDISIGCLNPRHTSTPFKDPVELYSRCSQGDLSGRIQVYPKIESINDVLDRSPLNSRGWCLQERILSRRIVHFAQDQLYWECETTSQAEDGTVLGMTADLKRLLSSFESDSDHVALRIWHRFVVDYSQRLLTNGSDLLPALAGLADAVRQRLTDPTYYAGIWKQDLPLGLLWSTIPSATARPSCCAPSWSWASVPGRVHSELRALALIHQAENESARVVDVKLTLHNPLFPLHKVDSGILTIRSQIKCISMQFVKVRNPEWPQEVTVEIRKEGIVANIIFDDHSRERTETLTAVMIWRGVHAKHGNRLSCFLALQPAGSGTMYKRIGAGYTLNTSFFANSPQTTIQII